MTSPPRKVKWNSLEHKGPVFHEPYQELPLVVNLIYDGKEIHLSKAAEEIAGFYAKLLNKKNTPINDNFNKNFWKDWRESMTDEERKRITNLEKCNFKSIQNHFKNLNKKYTKEEKNNTKSKKEEIQEKFGYCTIDGNREKIGNYYVEQPGLFRGLGEHPKNGMVKKRITAEDVTINCSKGNIPEPPSGHQWKAVKHDQTVMWLASWKDEIQKKIKYIKLHRKSTWRSNKDRDKFNKAWDLGNVIEDIRKKYREDWCSPDQHTKQCSVALYFIDKFALRPGNEKKNDQAKTVGCCSLRVEHITLHEQNVVEFDFSGKCSRPYHNNETVEKVVFENLESFIENKKPGNDLFDQVNARTINVYLGTLQRGLTAKVFRTYAASCTMEENLNEFTIPKDSVEDKIKSYKKALSDVAKLCNHKSEKSSESNYIDPRIIVAWSKKNEVPIKKLFTPNQLDIFRWALETESSYIFKTK